MPTITSDMIWEGVGFLGQAVFGMRFVVQWIATERRKKSVVPNVFWYLSIVGSMILLVYSIRIVKPVFIAGFSLTMVIYLRNLYYIHRRAHARPAASRAEDAAPPGPPAD